MNHTCLRIARKGGENSKEKSLSDTCSLDGYSYYAIIFSLDSTSKNNGN